MSKTLTQLIGPFTKSLKARKFWQADGSLFEWETWGPPPATCSLKLCKTSIDWELKYCDATRSGRGLTTFRKALEAYDALRPGRTRPGEKLVDYGNPNRRT